jgi:hypothetical protein
MTSSITARPSTVHYFATAMVTATSPTAINAAAFNTDTPTVASYQTPASLLIIASSTTSNVTAAATAPDEANTIPVCPYPDNFPSTIIASLIAVYYLVADTVTAAADTGTTATSFKCNKFYTMTTFHHVYFFHATPFLHDNTHLLDQSVLLPPYIATWTARYSAPSSIYDGALATLAQPSFMSWQVMIPTPIFQPMSPHLSPVSATDYPSSSYFSRLCLFLLYNL